MKINVNASTMVKPMTEKPSTTLWISNLDLIMRSNCHVSTIYFYRSTGAADFFDAAVLKAALSRALDEFYPVAGRLKMDGNDRVQIDCNGEGVLFVEAEADGLVDDLIGDFSPRPELNLIPEVDYSQGISTFPLLLLQVTCFKCGGVCLGIAMKHLLVDGKSSIHFLNTWSDLARGLDIAVPPFLDRRVLSARNPPQPKFPHIEYLSPPTLKIPQANKSNTSQTKFSKFKIRHDQLNCLKSNCLEDEQDKVTYSTYEVLAAHVWRCVSKARGLPEDQETILYIPADGRSRLRPPLPSGYFGNVVFTATAVASCGELESSHLKFVVSKIHEAIARADDDYLRSAIDYLELQGEEEPQARGTARYKCPNLGILSWSKFRLYDADFGWGKPMNLGFGTVPPEGSSVVLPSPENDGSLLFVISLPEEPMQVFEKLFYDI